MFEMFCFNQDGIYLSVDFEPDISQNLVTELEYGCSYATFYGIGDYHSSKTIHV